MVYDQLAGKEMEVGRFYLMRDQELAVFSVVSLSYAFATAAMMIPALSEFDFAFGGSRTSDEE